MDRISRDIDLRYIEERHLTGRIADVRVGCREAAVSDGVIVLQKDQVAGLETGVAVVDDDTRGIESDGSRRTRGRDTSSGRWCGIGSRATRCSAAST